MKKYIIASIFIFILILQSNFTFAQVLNVQKITTKNNIEIWLVEDNSVPVISITFSFAGGLDLDPIDKPGIARMVSILLDEGAGDISAEEFQKQLNDNSISLSFTAGRDDFYGELKTLTTNKEKAFSLLQLALTSPRFDEDAIERMKNSNIASIKNDMTNPSWLAARTFNGMLFEGHKYANPGAGTIKSTQAITRDDLVNFSKEQFNRASLKVAIAGDINREQAIELIDKTFAPLPNIESKTDLEPAKLQHKGKTILLEYDIPQSHIFLGSEGISYNHPLWFAANVMNYVLGGGSFDSRLMSEIREKRGLTYGVYSSLSPMKQANIIRANLATSNQTVLEAIEILKNEWQKMAENGITEQELTDAQTYITGSLLLNLTSTSSISSILNSYMREGLDYNYINTINKNINKVSLKDIKSVAKELLKKDNLTTIIVGRPQGIKADIILNEPPNM